MTNKKWYQSNWFIVLSLIFCLPLGLYLMWENRQWKTKQKVIITIICSSVFVTALNFFAVSSYDDFKANKEKEIAAKAEESSDEITLDDTDYQMEYESDALTDEPESDSSAELYEYESSDALSSTATREQKAALKSAETYSLIFHMSKAGIYDQLTSEFGDKFPADAAQYAVDNLDVDYNENALKSAENYAETFNMSSAEIYDQLISEYGEKFTAEQAQYAVDHLSE
ncbi:Ltp family lipoprotein [Staphylococcus sp. EZ-P03]|uniref:Ltp family lipoprotein n=1 Tax=Staphylococcus sp. EZ-P03 TaxID=2282739 RepID=UPI000DF7BD1D|nr:Ltp family lipoprotein [Staphylococcus sp. EZ-P03]